MNTYTIAMLILNIFLWLTHCEMGFSYEGAFCYKGKMFCSLFVIKVACELLGLASSLVIMFRMHKSWVIALLIIFALSLSIDSVILIYSANREDDHSPKVMIVYPGGFTLEQRR